MTHFNSQPQQPNQKSAALFLSLRRSSYRSAAIAYVHTSHWDYGLGSLFSWGFVPFWNMKRPGELERSAMERMNHSTTINHLSLDTFHSQACNNNSLPLTMAFRDVFCLSGVSIDWCVQWFQAAMSNVKVVLRKHGDDVWTAFDDDLSFSNAEIRVAHEEWSRFTRARIFWYFCRS